MDLGNDIRRAMGWHADDEMATERRRSSFRSAYRELATDALILMMLIVGVLVIVILWQVLAQEQLALHLQGTGAVR